MRRCLLVVIVSILAAPPAWSHFIWLFPADETQALVLFSDSLQPDIDPATKIAQTQWFVRHADGKSTPLKWAPAKEAPVLQSEGKGPCLVGGICQYGVIQRGNAEPFLLKYYAATVIGGSAREAAKLTETWDRLPLQIVPATPGQFQVIWQGKPLAAAEVAVVVPGKDKSIECKTNDQGLVECALTGSSNGRYGIRARHVEKKDGKVDGKDYKEVRHYSTLVVRADDKPKEDPAASKLLQDARAARAQWVSFPGFAADIEVNFGGKTSKGKVHVDSAGKLQFEGLDKNMESWAKRTLGSVVGHRLDDSASRNTPCAFIDDNKDHPLGRAIRVLNDELHSSYRIRDRQIMEVNRQMKEGKFSISVLENRPNAEGKFLSTSFVVNYWNLENGELQRSEAHHQAWTRVGKLDLPTTLTVITSIPEKSGASGRSAQSLTLSNHKLLPGK
jgi:hypothetical protein